MLGPKAIPDLIYSECGQATGEGSPMASVQAVTVAMLYSFKLDTI